MRNEDWALTEPVAESQCHIDYEHHQATLTNGKIIAIVNQKGQVIFYRHPHKPLLQEFWRLRGEIGEDESSHGQYVSALNLEGREFRPIQGGKYSLKARFEATEWEAQVSEQLDYWITAGDTPAEISRAYALATGTPPMMPDYAMGFWQCKLRYRTQEELLEVAREYKRRNLPISVIVIDFFHWPNQGDWMFDARDWPDPDAMIAELKSLGIELMVSVWPTVDNRTESATY